VTPVSREARRPHPDRAHHDHRGLASGAAAFATRPARFLIVRFLLALAISTGVSALIAAVALHIPRQVPLRRGVVPAE
jgi:hypothetical protein